MPPKKKDQIGTVEVPETGTELREGDVVGDNGAREEQVLAGTGQIEEAEFEVLDLGSIVNALALHNLEQFKRRPKPWDQLSQSEQRDLFAALTGNAKETVRKIVEAVARDGREPIRAMLDSYSEKDGIKVSLTVKPLDSTESLAAIIALHKAQGKHVLIVAASADDYDQGSSDPSQADQPGLGFEAGSDEHPEDSSDLAAEELVEDDQPSDPAHVKDGDKVAFAGASGRARINVETGWIEFLEDGEADLNANWQDMREATAEELAQERERRSVGGSQAAEPVEA